MKIKTLIQDYYLSFEYNNLRTETKLQYKYFLDRKSKLDGKNKLSKHQLGRAVDLAPYPIKWEESERFYYMGGMVMAIAKNLGFKVRWGGDWDRDGEVKDQSFMDLVHIEILD